VVPGDSPAPASRARDGRRPRAHEPLCPGAVDLFIHDSLHTSRNTHFEIECVWPVIPLGGIVLADDVEQNAAFGSFARAHADAKALVCDAADGRSQFGCLLRSRSA
jgi:hypothetical protein